MTDLIKEFSYEGKQVRMATDLSSGETMFCLKDICSVLDIANDRQVKNRLDEDDVCLIDTVDSIGKKAEMTFVTESGMYDNY